MIVYGRYVRFPSPLTRSWTGVATWTWVANDENCGICRMAFDGCCPDCKLPGDDCPLGETKTWDIFHTNYARLMLELLQRNHIFIYVHHKYIFTPFFSFRSPPCLTVCFFSEIC